jgi:hypothetical protein
VTFQLKPRDFHPPIPLTNVALILPYTCLLESMGAPVERLLARSGIPVGLLQHPAATVPLQNAFRFGELACRTQGTEYLGLNVGLANSLDDYGSYGQILKRSLTIHEYLRKGIALYNTLITGQRCWLSEYGKVLRFNVATVGEPGLGSYQSHLETLVVTIATLRCAAGRDWSPAEISLAYKSREPPPEIDLFPFKAFYDRGHDRLIDLFHQFRRPFNLKVNEKLKPLVYRIIHHHMSKLYKTLSE